MRPDVVRIGSALVEMHADGLTVTRFPSGLSVDARPQDDATYLARAQALGYGSDVLAMSREHELTHSLLAKWLSIPGSPTLRGVAEGAFWPHWQAEEAAVLGVQRFARLAGVDLLELASPGDRRGAGAAR